MTLPTIIIPTLLFCILTLLFCLVVMVGVNTYLLENYVRNPQHGWYILNDKKWHHIRIETEDGWVIDGQFKKN